MKGIMFQGTASDVGKSVIVTAICRILANKGFNVAPFKSQNMSNNSYITDDGKEIGLAQAIQAEAAKVKANVYMNPILLKPKSDQMSEIIRLGVPYEKLSGKNYRKEFYELELQTIQQSLQKLKEQFDYIVIEGAGSPVEINLNDRELVNMKVAELADVPVVLIADIDRGGVFASIYGTLALMNEADRKRVKGIIINKFRGDVSLFESGIEWIEQNTGVKVLGVVPYLPNVTIEGEDSLSMQKQFTQKINGNKRYIDIAIINIPYVANYTDFAPFRYEEDVHIRFVHHVNELKTPDAIFIPSTKNVIHAIKYLREQGLADAIRQYVNEGGNLFAVGCGYQLLSETIIAEDEHVKSISEQIEGLKIAPLITYVQNNNTTTRSTGILAQPILGMRNEMTGFEIHNGKTEYKSDDVRPLLYKNGKAEGVNLNDGQIIGTNFHQIFHNDEWRTYWLNELRQEKGLKLKQVKYLQKERNATYDALAEVLENTLNIDYIIQCMNEWRECYDENDLHSS